MKKWIEMLPKSDVERKCSSHRDRPAVAVLMRERKEGKPPVPVRYYCQECGMREAPGLVDHGSD